MYKDKYRFSFVILHYLTIDDTICCVDSIKKYCVNYNYNIIIVDNGSKNNTGSQLVQKYKDDNDVQVIVSKDNLGFAKGNNLGYMYAKKNLNSDFIILANNDTMLINNSFCDEVCREYEKSKFALLGPKIYLKDNKINGISYPKIDINTLKRQLLRYKLSLFCDKVVPIYFLKQGYRHIKNKFKRTKSVIKSSMYDPEMRHENILIHGCFMIFSKKYIELFDGLNSKTFLYREEELIYKQLQKNKLLNVYNPKIVIKHNEDSATDALNKTNRKKSIFVNTNRIKSTKILINECLGDNNEN